MQRSRHSTIALLLYVLAVAVPPGAQAVEPQGGRLGAGLTAVAEGKVPGGSIVTRTEDGVREIAVSVEFAEEPGSAIRGRLRSAGLDTRGSWLRTIEGYVRPGDLKRLAATPGVLAVRAIRTPITDSYVGQAPGIHGASPWIQALYSGKGVKVGILDGGFDGFSGRLGSELPSTVQALCFPQLGVSSANVADCVTPGDSHGTAVAESIIDMAPSVSLYISNASSTADLAAAIRWMTGAGVRVINFSQITLPEGMGDGTSPYSNSHYALVNLAVAGGALFVASAGNEGETSWMGPPTDTDADGWLDFAPGDERDSIGLRAGDEITAAIRWDSAAADYDLAIWQGNTKLAESTRYDPAGYLELIDFTAPADGTYEISIRHAAGPVAATMRLMVHTSSDTKLTYRTTTGSLPTPADSRNPGMLTVGAVNYLTPTIIEPYSSQGPTLDGRIKPDLVAVDCVDTTVLPVFCGTSQAAPFVSAAAALLLEADPTLTPVALATLLKQRAVPLGTPVPNNVFGHGLLSLGPIPASTPMATSFLAPPASGTVGGPLLGQPTVGVVDAGGRVTSTGPGATLAVTLSLAGPPTGSTLTCDGGNSRVAVAGIAAFSGCSVDIAGTNYMLRADVAGLAATSSMPFSIVFPGTPARVLMALSPTTIIVGQPLAGTVSLAQSITLLGAPVLEWSKDARVWTSIGDIALDAAGTGPFTLNPTTNRWVRARVVGADGVTDVTPGVLIRVNSSAVFRSSIPTGRAILRTTRVTLTETIRPIGTDAAQARARFDFFLRVGTSWVRKRTLYANADSATGRASIVATMPTSGSWWIRSRAEPTATNGASTWTPGFRYLVR